MTDQSPKAQRAHAPGEKYDSDDLPQPEIGGGGQSKVQGPAAKGPQVPDLDFGRAGYQGGFTERDDSKSTSAAAPDRSGNPGHVESDDAKRTGGLVERFSGDRGGNS